MNIPENILSTLTDEQKKKIETARTPEELLAIAKETGYELTPDQLETVAGGSWCGDKCYFCDHGPCHEECTRHYPCGKYCPRVSE